MIITVPDIKYEFRMSPAKNNALCFSTPPASPSAIESAQRVRDLERTLFPVWTRAKIWLRTRGYVAWGVWRVLKLTLRNVQGHIGILLAKSPSALGCGPMLEKSPTGRLCTNRRTHARVLGIRELAALYPWASSIEERIFLAGFDMGEEFALHLSDIPLEEISYPDTSVS